MRRSRRGTGGHASRRRRHGGRPGASRPGTSRRRAESPAAFGDWLRRQREMREISLRDIADRTKISLRYLQAMEDDRFDLLPAPIFAKGFLREYARYVGLSPDEVVNHYLSVQQQRSRRGGRVKKDPTLAGQRPGRPKPVRELDLRPVPGARRARPDRPGGRARLVRRASPGRSRRRRDAAADRRSARARARGRSPRPCPRRRSPRPRWRSPSTSRPPAGSR